MRENFSDFNINITNFVAVYHNIETGETERKIFNLDRDTFLKKLATFNYRGYYNPQDRDPKVENMLTMPFAYHYYAMTLKNGVPPSPQEFVNTYFAAYTEPIGERNGKQMGHFRREFLQYASYHPFPFDAMKGRLLRAYNSYNRELDVFLYMRDNLANHGYKVEYDLTLDTADGINLLVYRDGFQLGIASFLESSRANFYKARKDVRYLSTRQTNVDIKNFKAVMSGPERNVKWVGDVMLYDDTALKKLRKTISHEFQKSKEKERVIVK